MKNNKKYGFTLIELMVVVAIIAALAMVGIPLYNKFRYESLQRIAMEHVRTFVTSARQAHAHSETEFVIKSRSYKIPAMMAISDLNKDLIDILEDENSSSSWNVGPDICKVALQWGIPNAGLRTNELTFRVKVFLNGKELNPPARTDACNTTGIFDSNNLIF